MCMVFLSPGSSRSGRESVSRCIFHNDGGHTHPLTPFKVGFRWLFIPCLVCIWLTCQQVELGSKQDLLPHHEVLKQAWQTSFEAIVSRYCLRLIPSSFSTKLLSSCTNPSIFWCLWLFLCRCETAHFLLLNFLVFQLSHFSSLSWLL